MLHGKQAKALDALLSGCTVAEAAAASGASVRSVGRWLRDPEFCAAMADATATALESTAAGLAVLAPAALDAYAAALADDTLTTLQRARVAGQILQHILRLQNLGGAALTDNQLFGLTDDQLHALLQG